MDTDAFLSWRPHLAIAITGHRPDNPALAANQEAVDGVLAALFDQIDALHEGDGEVRLNCLLAGGIDQTAAHQALKRDWKLIAPLPFGVDLNVSINAAPTSVDDAAALAKGTSAKDAAVEARAKAIRDLVERAHVFEIADRDAEIRSLYETTLSDPSDHNAAHRFAALSSDNVALAGRVMIERCDILIAVWDGKMTDLPGGTGHTVLKALEQATPVLVIDPTEPKHWSILTTTEQLGHRSAAAASPDRELFKTLIHQALGVDNDPISALKRETWRAKSGFGFGIYRQIERLFGGRSAKSGTTKAVFEAPDAISEGSGVKLLDASAEILADGSELHSAMQAKILPLFAWADGVSARLSDAYRSGMTVNFILSAAAIIAGIAYLPLSLAAHKWIFASIELVLLVGILLVTYAGYRRAWHRRWFETRRLAEYLRFAPGNLLMGVARPIGRWPRGENGEWPERLSRDALREAGLPKATVDRAYLRRVLENVVLPHVREQRAYHEAKASQLHRVHHRIDSVAELAFLAAVVSVSVYLLIELGAALSWWPASEPAKWAKLFTFLGVAFPTIGANLAGIRYFGDFDRFAAISEVTATRLAGVEERIELLLKGDESRLTYRNASQLVRAADAVVVEEIESWQAVYGNKHLALPA